MKEYVKTLTSDLLQEARKNLNTIRKCEECGPLTAIDVYPKAWAERKLNSNTTSMIQSLKVEGCKLELHWKALTKGTSHLEEQRSFRPTVIGGVSTAGKVPSLMQLKATVVWDYGQELSMHDLPRECRSSYKTCQTLCSLQTLIFHPLWAWMPSNYLCKKSEGQIWGGSF